MTSMTQAPVVSKRVTDRRSLTFNSLSEILADAESVGPHARVTGNWTAAQIVEHVTTIIDGGLDGMPEVAPWPMRMMGKIMKKMALAKPFKPGYKIPGSFSRIKPASDVTWDHAIDHLRTAVGRIEAGERMTHPSPFLGPMSHDDWVKLHCRHAELHFSFMHPA